jgi:hypothetical protein
MPSDIFLESGSETKMNYTRREVHDVRLMHGGDTLPPTGLRIVEGVASDTLRCIPSNQFDRLDDTVDYLKVGVCVSFPFPLECRLYTPRARFQNTLPLYFHGSIRCSHRHTGF